MNKVIILCGGKGKRLGFDYPKSMVLINGQVLLEKIISNCTIYGFKHITLKTGFKHKVIQYYFKKGQHHQCFIEYKRDKTIMGTAGGLNYLSYEKQPIFIIYGDICNTVDMNAMLNYHKEVHADVTMCVIDSSHPEDSDVVIMNQFNKVIKTVNKPGHKKFGTLTNGAMYIINPKIFNYIPLIGKFDFGKDLIPLLIKDKKHVFAYRVSETSLLDIGTPERLEQARCNKL